MKIVKYYGVTNGRLDNPEILQEDLKHFEGKRFKITMDDDKKRSPEQNSYIHAVLFPLIREFFNSNKKEGTSTLTIDDIKDWVRQRGYWGYKNVGKDAIPKRSSEATTAEMVNGIEKLQIDFAKWGLQIPDPNEQDYRLGKEYEPPNED
jgi:hypothetical protein